MQPDACEPQSAPDATEASEAQAALETEIARLRDSMGARAGIDQAVGVILTMGRMTPAEAWDVLREVSMRTDVTVRQVARQLVEYARSGELPRPVRDELERQVMRRGPDGR
ncbi:ANTAR domain-containing protein [Streptomyces sp. SID8379]|uniref:ANTAR domain-containing protein n=1 Tax=unclassified Streptomyces TaxID=2593676 RepID=UPI000363FE80|nr:MULTISPECIES: ANTAR domain-containing protein [unclassified Streptomyces]MYW63458.1 ANTAR domain-containing protein [Streptomyces sp. SID8379]